MKKALWMLLLAAFFVLQQMNAHACQVPVYRYAMENWSANPFHVTVFHRGPLTASQKEAFDWLPKEGANPTNPVNIEAKDVDLMDPDPVSAGLWSIQGNPELPWVVVEFPSQDRMAHPAWTGPLDLNVMKNLVDSPVRRDLARRLLRGDSAVWVLVQTNDAKAAQTVASIEVELRKLETTLKLPLPEKGTAPRSEPTALKIPLKIGFSTILVHEDDPAEKMFLQILRQTSRQSVPSDAAVVAYPVFGRGRCLGGQAGDNLTPKAIEKECAFIIGACSCMVKSQNPGVDLPMLVKWDDFVKGSMLASKAVPPLMSLMPVAPMVSASGTSDPSAPKETPISKTSAVIPLSTPQHVTLKLSIFAVLGIAVLLVSGCTLFIWRRPR